MEHHALRRRGWQQYHEQHHYQHQHQHQPLLGPVGAGLDGVLPDPSDCPPLSGVSLGKAIVENQEIVLCGRGSSPCLCRVRLGDMLGPGQ